MLKNMDKLEAPTSFPSYKQKGVKTPRKISTPVPFFFFFLIKNRVVRKKKMQSYIYAYINCYEISMVAVQKELSA